MQPARCSVIITVKNRESQLKNSLKGLSDQIQLPAEVVIVRMNEPLREISAENLTIKQVLLEDTESAIPLGHARNLGAREAFGEQLLFLDVDCIPAHNWTEVLCRHQAELNGLLMGDITYLNRQTTTVFTETYDYGILHGEQLPFRPEIAPGTMITDADYSLFWSLNFAISQQKFLELGGFDTNFRGYGAEDTDLAFRARNREIPFGICSAMVYHQYHDIYNPPLNHFDSIIANARKFYGNHGIWPMMSWLEEFASMGLLQLEGSNLEVIRQPTEEEVASTKVTDGRSYK